MSSSQNTEDYDEELGLGSENGPDEDVRHHKIFRIIFAPLSRILSQMDTNSYFTRAECSTLISNKTTGMCELRSTIFSTQRRVIFTS